ncbi:glycosyltransferase [Saccharolobus islandicus]|nr:glycosyltransferase [Sulfolobus islandicus]
MLLGLELLTLHFSEPLAYFFAIKDKRIAEVEAKGYEPVSIIIPTYNEGDKIRDKLLNVMKSYPLEYAEIILVDSSTDNTTEVAKSLGIPIKIVKEKERRGKIFAVKEGIRNASNDIVVITDADALWDDPLIDAIKYLKGEIGAVSCIKRSNRGTENAYRNFYNVIRLSESAIYSTPIFHGELTAFRKSLLSADEIPNAGADDSSIATLIALKGYRAICTKVRAFEYSPKGLDYFSWKTRRGLHLVRHFVRFLPKVMRSKNRKYKAIFLEEFYLHLINPWFLVLGVVLTAIYLPKLFLFLLLVLLIALVIPQTRELVKAWVPNQFFLIMAQFKALRGEFLMWKKESK